MQAININTKPDKTAESHLNEVTEFDIKQSKRNPYLYKRSIHKKFQMWFDFYFTRVPNIIWVFK
jgi:hypothetical protein